MFGSCDGGVGWGGVGLITFLGNCIWFVLRSQNIAGVVNVREHKFHGTFIEYVATLSHALGATLASGLCCYALWWQGPAT